MRVTQWNLNQFHLIMAGMRIQAHIHDDTSHYGKDMQASRRHAVWNSRSGRRLRTGRLKGGAFGDHQRRTHPCKPPEDEAQALLDVSTGTYDILDACKPPEDEAQALLRQI